jgi:hypothetical protein
MWNRRSVASGAPGIDTDEDGWSSCVVTKAFRSEDFKPRPEPAKSGPKPAKSEPFLSWICDYDMPLRGLPAGFVAEDPNSNCMFLAIAFVDALPISLGAYCTRREAALVIAEVHNGGESTPRCMRECDD